MTTLFNSDIAVDDFLADYWQQKPLLLRGAFPGYQSPISADELAGISCEQDSNARLILESCGERPWAVEYGPFDEERFSSLPETGWSLLVSDLERLIPEIKALQSQFRFIPDWRFDDVMISYAPDGASVGPHVDQYDVFLLQTWGKRRWFISEHPTQDYLPDTDMHVLQHLDAEQDWLLEPGDMLYLPPGVAHHGVAEGECMTCSIGFRSPCSGQIASEFIEYHRQSLDEILYSDAGMRRQSHPAEITPESLARLRRLIATVTEYDDAALARWFGEFVSENRSTAHALTDADADSSAPTLMHNPCSRFVFTRAADDAVLCVDGNSYDVSTAFAEALCASVEVDMTSLRSLMRPGDAEVIEQLVDKGCLVSDVD